MHQPIWISHRGDCRDATENSLAAFRAAKESGFTHFETDLRTSADGHIVLAHDANLQRVSDSRLLVEESKRGELERLRLHCGERLATFDELVQEFGRYNWIFDIKPESAIRTVDALLLWWAKPKWAEFFEGRVRFLFWDSAHQSYLQQRQPAAQCMARLSECRRAAFACLLGVPAAAGIRPGVSYALPPRWKGMNLMHPSIVQRYRSKGGRVLAYLPGNEVDTRRALEAGVDEILTNGLPLHSVHSQ